MPSVKRSRRSTSLSQSVRRLALAQRQKPSLELSKQLARLHTSDRDGFRDLIASGVLSRRSAYYLVKIGHMIRTAKLAPSRAEKIGWTKLSIIAGQAEPKQVAALLKLAETMTAQELKIALRNEGSGQRPHCVQLYFSTGQYRLFRRAILRHGGTSARRGLAGKEQALVRIIHAAEH